MIIPAHNEAHYLEKCLNSFVAQTLQPNDLIIVDDNSTDSTHEIASKFAAIHDWISVIKRISSDEHHPGKKVIDTFNFGLQQVGEYQLIGKFDADIILPSNYFELIVNQFQSDWKLGMCSGLLHIEVNGKWLYENVANKNHIRGPIKLYHKACFDKIGGLRPGVGWDTVDVLLAQFHGFTTRTVPGLKVKHLRPTGHGYTLKKWQSKGEALYKMRYGIVLAKLAALKMAWHAKSPLLYIQTILGYINAVARRPQRFVTPKEGRFIRKLRWKGIQSKL